MKASGATLAVVAALTGVALLALETVVRSWLAVPLDLAVVAVADASFRSTRRHAAALAVLLGAARDLLSSEPVLFFPILYSGASLVLRALDRRVQVDGILPRAILFATVSLLSGVLGETILHGDLLLAEPLVRSSAQLIAAALAGLASGPLAAMLPVERRPAGERVWT